VERSAERVRAVVLRRESCQAGPNDARWPVHSCGGTAIEGLKLAQLLGRHGVLLTFSQYTQWWMSVYSSGLIVRSRCAQYLGAGAKVITTPP
jgi:hypothetical protein